MSSLGALKLTKPLTALAHNAGDTRARTATRMLIVGTGQRAAALAAAMSREADLVIVGAVDVEDRGELAAIRPSIPWLGHLDDVSTLALEHAVDEICVALPLRSCFDHWRRVIAIGQEVGIPVSFDFDIVGDAERVEFFANGSPAVRCNVHPTTRRLAPFAKRAFDIVVGTAALIALSPALLLGAALVKLSSPGPILFRQPRVGRGRRVFGMLKFRTMVHNAEALRAGLTDRNDASGIMFKIDNDPRLTWAGPFLRRTSLDELPQLFNVLRGEMSLVGPRPIPTWVYEQIDEPSFHRRFSVLPGMTGLWQVHGRPQEYRLMARHDLRYVDDWSFLLDLKILAKTIPAVVRREGAR
jgi:exopolysaccharide biosynthesis polyprenyl glycosylphosphotransferase